LHESYSDCDDDAGRKVPHMINSASSKARSPMTLRRLRQKRQEILDLCAHRGGSNVRVFGSVGRGEARRGSDVDFLIDLEPKRSYLDLAHLYFDLEEFLHCPVDVVTEKELHWYIRDRVVKEAKPL
jgi:predicted nucleotidyltransferase